MKIVAIVCQISRNYTIFIQCNQIDESNAPSSIDWRSLYGSSACHASNLTTFFAQYKFDVKIHFQLICLANASFAVSFCVNWANFSVCEKLQFHFRSKVRYIFFRRSVVVIASIISPNTTDRNIQFVQFANILAF